MNDEMDLAALRLPQDFHNMIPETPPIREDLFKRGLAKMVVRNGRAGAVWASQDRNLLNYEANLQACLQDVNFLIPVPEIRSWTEAERVAVEEWIYAANRDVDLEKDEPPLPSILKHYRRGL